MIQVEILRGWTIHSPRPSCNDQIEIPKVPCMIGNHKARMGLFELVSRGHVGITREGLQYGTLRVQGFK